MTEASLSLTCTAETAVLCNQGSGGTAQLQALNFGVISGQESTYTITIDAITVPIAIGVTFNRCITYQFPALLYSTYNV